MNMNDIFPGLDAATNVHPILVHLPLGLWPTALAFLLLGALRRSERLMEVGRWLLYIGTLAAGVAAFSGWNAANSLGHDSPGHDFVHVHRNWMFAAAALSVASCVIAWVLRSSTRTSARWFVAGSLLVTLAVATLGADRGAYLVYGKGVGTTISTDQNTPKNEPHEENEDSGHSHGR